MNAAIVVLAMTTARVDIMEVLRRQEAMKAAGHATTAMTARYTLQDVEREKELAERLSKRLAG